MKKSFACAADRTPVVQSVVRHYTDRAIPAPPKTNSEFKSQQTPELPVYLSYKVFTMTVADHSARAVQVVGFYCWHTGIVGSNPV
jgi:hypothetical protein